MMTKVDGHSWNRRQDNDMFGEFNFRNKSPRLTMFIPMDVASEEKSPDYIVANKATGEMELYLRKRKNRMKTIYMIICQGLKSTKDNRLLILVGII